MTALIWASARGHLEVVNQLLDCKEIDTSSRDKVQVGILATVSTFSNLSENSSHLF